MIQAWYNNVLHKIDLNHDNIDYNQLHRDIDKPSLIWYDGSRKWFKYGKIHRDGDKPAMITSNGCKFWWKNGKKHRDNDKPAIVWTDGSKSWWKNGKRHRDGDKPAAIYFPTKSKSWFKNDLKYQYMDLQKLYLLQFWLIFLCFGQKNRMKYHPECFLGKLIKNDIVNYLEKMKFN